MVGYVCLNYTYSTDGNFVVVRGIKGAGANRAEIVQDQVLGCRQLFVLVEG